MKAFVPVIFSPNQIFGEVEQMMALHRQAARLAANDPAQAAALRHKASKIGL